MSHRYEDFENEEVLEDEPEAEPDEDEEEEEEEYLPELDIGEDGHVRPRRRKKRDDYDDAILPEDLE